MTPNPLALADALAEKPDSDGHCRQAADWIREQHAAIERKDALLRQAFEAMKDFDYDKRLAAIAAITKELSQ